MKHPILLALLCCLTSTFATRAELVQWDERLLTDVGRGFNPFRPEQFDEPRPFVAVLDAPTVGGSAGSSFNTYFTQSKEDIARFLGVNLAVSVSAIAYSGDLNTSFTDRFNSSEDTVTFVVNARRDFGTVNRLATGLTANFTNEVNLMRQTLRGSFLYQAISNRFGSHFISGYKSSARLAVMYKFHFASRAQARQFKASFGFDSGSVNINSAVNTAFSQNNSSVSIEYHLDTLGRGTPPNLWPTNVINTPAEFLQFGQAVDSYWRGLNETNGVATDYIAEPIENLPGFAALVDGYSPSTLFNADYNRFMTVHGKLKSWHEMLLYWAVDSRRMSWMNSTGQTMVRALERDAFRELSALEAKGRDHFERGTPLVVEDNTLSFFQNFDRIPRPSIYVVRNYQVGGPFGIHMFGWIDCGSRDLTVPTPFLAVSHRLDGNNDPASEQIRFSGADYEQFVRNRWQGFPGGSIAFLDTMFSSPQWIAITNEALTRRIVFFESSTLESLAPRVTVLIRDLAGNTVDELGFLSTRSGGIAGASLDAVTNSDVRIDELPRPAQAAVDSRTPYQFTVTNLNLSPAYGTLATLPIPAGMQVLAASGSQGQAVTTNGVLVVTNGQVLYQIGPLGYGSAATIRLDLAPLRTGVLTAATPATVTVGDGLTDPNLSNNTVPLAPLTAVLPLLSVARTPGNVELSWVSETGRLNLQSTPTLNAMPSWLPVTNAPAPAGGTRTLRLPTTGSRKFYRLQMPPL